MQIADDVEARLAYLARLQDLAEPTIRFLSDVARANPGQPLVVLCFEDVHAGGVCHRTWFAEWMKGRFGITVKELP